MAEMDERCIILLRPDGNNETIKVPGGPTLETLQTLVGGNIETVPSILAPNWTRETGDRIILVINEEGKNMGLPVNKDATVLSALLFDDIVGNAVLCAAKGEKIMAFTQEVADVIRRRWAL